MAPLCTGDTAEPCLSAGQWAKSVRRTERQQAPRQEFSPFSLEILSLGWTSVAHGAETEQSGKEQT